MYPCIQQRQDIQEKAQEIMQMIDGEGYKVSKNDFTGKWSYEDPTGWKSLGEWDEEGEVYQFIYVEVFHSSL